MENNQSNATATGTKYKGVYRCGRKFKAQIQIERVQHYLGLFDSEIEAAVAYDNHARILLGNRARTNFEYNEDQADPDLSRQLFDTQYFSVSRMESQISETNNLPPKRKRGYASIQECPPLDSLNSMEILAVKPKRERNVVARSSNNKKRTSFVSTDDLNEAGTLTTAAGSTSSTSSTTGSSSNNVILSNISIPHRPIHAVSTSSDANSFISNISIPHRPIHAVSTSSDANSFISNHSDTSTNGMNNTVYLRRAAAMAAHTVTVTASTAATASAAVTSSIAAASVSTTAVATSSIDTESLSVCPPQQIYTLTTLYPPTNPESIPIEVIAETTTTHRTTCTGTSTSTSSTYWAGVLYIDPVSELQVWKGTYVECSDTTTRPTAAAFTNNTNAFEYNIMPDPSTITTTTTTTTMTTEYSTVVTPQSGTLVGSYLSSIGTTGTMTNTECSFQLLFEPLEEPGMVSMRYSALGSGIDTSGKFIVCGVYSSISGVLELRKLYLED